ncbi:hypothetical protein BDZ89DRAFT_1032877 [Hymenopellis radicata]|nr:hypothetical protein BDZ89DRAFT_1032877 [Hymenopellis radicata]
MARPLDSLLRRWHRMLGLRVQSPPSWYKDRVREELRERRTARTCVQTLSETSDVFFSIMRARYDGFPVRTLPPFVASRHTMVYAYMLGKYSLRWGFYRVVAILCRARHSVCEVVNPGKDDNLRQVALRHQIDPEVFTRVGRKTLDITSLEPAGRRRFFEGVKRLASSLGHYRQAWRKWKI